MSVELQHLLRCAAADAERFHGSAAPPPWRSRAARGPARPVVIAVLAALAALGGVLLALGPSVALAAEPPADLRPLRAAFARGDAQAIADLSVLPFLYGGERLDRSRFVAEVVPALFTAPVRRCLQHVAPQPEQGRLMLWCKPYGFYLDRVDGTWRLAEFTADLP